MDPNENLQRERTTIDEAVRHAVVKTLREEGERFRGAAAAAFLANIPRAEELRDFADEIRRQAAAVENGAGFSLAKRGA
ncbi:hypothetical protein BH23GEM7_BH23GEM7_27100 [soil metagenome]